MSAQQLEYLDRRLRSVAGLTVAVGDALNGLKFRAKSFEAGELLYPPGAAQLPCYILLEGAAIRFKMRSDGSQAIVSFELPGDIINLETLLLQQVDCGVTAAADCTVAVVDRGAMTAALSLAPGLESALWRYAAVKAAALEEWLLNVGKRSPVGRISHLLMELSERLDAVQAPGISNAHIFASTKNIADAMGITEVIAIRVLHGLTTQGIISCSPELIVIEDRERLARLGEFLPDYLHIRH